MILSFDCCPLDFIGKNLSIWFKKFPKVYILSFKHLEFYWNGKNKTKTEYSVTRVYLLLFLCFNFIGCNIPKDNSLSKFLKGQKINSIK
eukprot:snap_masked-scaffold_10-processed-gene-0.45-mRNA-1 protein AED:1.00 eAED:1.00 QI:0/0/0/0/1/1/3/0/88